MTNPLDFIRDTKKWTLIIEIKLFAQKRQIYRTEIGWEYENSWTLKHLLRKIDIVKADGR